jgi:hypothetical protein
MTALQTTFVGAALIVAVGTGIYETGQNYQLRNQIQKLQQEQERIEPQSGMRDSRGASGSAPVAASSNTDSNAVPSDRVIAEIESALAQPMWGGERDAMFRRLKDKIAPADIPSALAFLVQQADQNGINTPLFDDLAVRWGSEDPNAAVQWANGIRDTNVEARAFVDVMQGWGKNSHVDAANYAAKLPAGHLQTDSLKGILNDWAFWDPGAAARWLSQNPQFADDGVGPIFFWGQGRCADELANLLDAVSSESLYQKNGESVGASWLKSDKWAARAWIKQAPLSEDVKQRLLNQD